MHTQFKRNVHEMSSEISAVFKDDEFHAVFNPRDILLIARNQIALRIADKITESLFPLLEQAIKDCKWDTAKKKGDNYGCTPYESTSGSEAVKERG